MVGENTYYDKREDIRKSAKRITAIKVLRVENKVAPRILLRPLGCHLFYFKEEIIYDTKTKRM